MNILFIGDIIGQPGRTAIAELIPVIRDKYSVDFIIANGENSAGGFGLVPKSAEEIMEAGVDVITTGNHIFDRKEYVDVIDFPYILRPANYPDIVPGKGFCVVGNVAVVNLLGNFNMPPVHSPFYSVESVLGKLAALPAVPKIIIVDFHAELTSEKKAMGYFLDGRVSAVLGTHTHVQTADEIVLPGGTGFITDVGMVGAVDSVIGVNKAEALKKFLSGMPVKYRPAKGDMRLDAVCIEVDDDTGRCRKIRRVAV